MRKGMGEMRKWMGEMRKWMGEMRKWKKDIFLSIGMQKRFRWTEIYDQHH